MLGEHWLATGLDTVRKAAQTGWHTNGGQQHVCPDCVYEGTEEETWPISELRLKVLEGPPQGYKPAMLICSCGAKTNRQKGKCRGCKKELEISGEVVDRSPEERKC
jgi:hypothetical protein